MKYKYVIDHTGVVITVLPTTTPAPTGAVFVVCETSVIQKTAVVETAGLEGEISVTRTEMLVSDYRAALIDTIEYWREQKQSAGFMHVDGRKYSTTETTRGMIMGKLQEVTLTGAQNVVFPDYSGNPVLMTTSEFTGMAISAAAHIEDIYMQAVDLTSQIISMPSVGLADVQEFSATYLAEQDL